MSDLTKREKLRTYHKKWRDTNPDKLKVIRDTERNKHRKRIYDKEWHQNNYMQHKLSNNSYYIRNKNRLMPIHKEYRRKLRDAVLNFLGGKCVKCGFSDPRALQIDHVNGGGIKDRNEGGITYYRKVLNDSVGKYQLLCANCNVIKRIENEEFGKKGVCNVQ